MIFGCVWWAISSTGHWMRNRVIIRWRGTTLTNPAGPGVLPILGWIRNTGNEAFWLAKHTRSIHSYNLSFKQKGSQRTKDGNRDRIEAHVKIRGNHSLATGNGGPIVLWSIPSLDTHSVESLDLWNLEQLDSARGEKEESTSCNTAALGSMS